MDTSQSRFFIALLPPQPILDQANHIKQYFADRYNSRGAQKSPPHITLQPPFLWENQQISTLKQSLESFVASIKPIPITLNNYAAFPPRVIYINVLKTSELLTLQTDLISHLHTHLHIPSDNRPFTPHMTVAFRDLTKANFHLAWSEFIHRSFEFEFFATSLTLLRHNGQRWLVDTEFPFLEVL